MLVLSPVSLASRDQDGGPSDSTIDIYDPTEKQGTVNSLLCVHSLQPSSRNTENSV